jgi:hypothetical protein
MNCSFKGLILKTARDKVLQFYLSAQIAFWQITCRSLSFCVVTLPGQLFTNDAFVVIDSQLFSFCRLGASLLSTVTSESLAPFVPWLTPSSSSVLSCPSLSLSLVLVVAGDAVVLASGRVPTSPLLCPDRSWVGRTARSVTSTCCLTRSQWRNCFRGTPRMLSFWRSRQLCDARSMIFGVLFSD